MASADSRRKIAKLTGVDNNSAARKKAGKAVWNDKKEALTKDVDAPLLKEFGIDEWTKADTRGDCRSTRRLNNYV
jgi:hypothetical protein